MQIEGVELELLAAQVGTPFYGYSATSLSDAYDRWFQAEDWRSAPAKA